ncbi:hypothetical protein ACFSMW_00995 [Virgibacillus halophilus]
MTDFMVFGAPFIVLILSMAVAFWAALHDKHSEKE